MVKSGRMLLVAATMLAMFSHADAEEFRVYATPPSRASLNQIAKDFEQQTGHKAAITFETAAGVEKLVRTEASCDAVFVADQQIASLARDGKVVDALALGRAFLAVGVKGGSPAPDISSPDALKASLLSARKVAYSAGLSGSVFVSKLERLGIQTEVKAKSLVISDGSVGDALLRDEASLGVQQSVELKAVEGVEIIGPFPAELAVNFPASTAACATANGAGKAFVAYLRSNPGRTVFKDRGWILTD